MLLFAQAFVFDLYLDAKNGRVKVAVIANTLNPNLADMSRTVNGDKCVGISARAPLAICLF